MILLIMPWRYRRQLIYLFSVIGFFLVVGLAVYFIYKPEPTCFDNKQNQDEEGVDCGGPCQLACVQSVIPLKTYWTRPLKTADGVFDVASLVENQNQDLGIRKLFYTIYFYDGDNVLITTREGETFVNPGEKFLLFESNIKTGVRDIKKTFIEFSRDIQWEKATLVQPVVSVERKEFVNEEKPRLRLRVVNTSLDRLRDVKIMVVMSDNYGNAFAASSSFVDSLAVGESKDVFLTWPKQFLNSPSYIDSYWRLNGFSLSR